VSRSIRVVGCRLACGSLLAPTARSQLTGYLGSLHMQFERLIRGSPGTWTACLQLGRLAGSVTWLCDMHPDRTDVVGHRGRVAKTASQ
jgi:hypothetical protein